MKRKKYLLLLVLAAMYCESATREPSRLTLKTTTTDETQQRETSREFDDIAIGKKHLCLIEDSDVLCYGDNQYGQSRPQSGWWPSADKIYTGDWHSCLQRNNTIICWGLSHDYQTEIDFTKLTKLSVGSNHSCALTNGQVYCWGNNEYLQSNPHQERTDRLVDISLPIISNVSSLSAADKETCVIQFGRVKCWGIKSQTELYSHENIYSIDLPSVVHIALSSTLACAASSSMLYCWPLTIVNQKPIIQVLTFKEEIQELRFGKNRHCLRTSQWLCSETIDAASGTISVADFKVLLLPLTKLVFNQKNICGLDKNKFPYCIGKVFDEIISAL